MGYNPYGHTDRGLDYHYAFNVAKEQTDMADPNNQWKLVSRAELDALYENATKENPADVSYMIANPGLSRVWDINKWTKECDGGNGGAHITVGDDGNFDRKLVEAAISHAEFQMREHDFGTADGVVYAMMSLSCWLYEVSVSGFFRQGDGGFQAGVVNEGGELISEAYLEANGEKAFLPNIASEAGKMPGIFSQNSNNGTFANWPAEALQAFEAGLYGGTKVLCTVGIDGKLTLGVKQDQKTTDASWVLFDTFRLTYLGPVQIETMSILGDFTGGWELENAQDMTQDSENPAIWTLTVDNFKVEIEEGQTERKYEYKATANHMWGAYELPATGNQDWVFGSDMYPAGEYKLVFTADTENHTLSLSVEKAVVDAISELNADTTGRVVFNLQGQKMQQTNKGLYIINGNKVVIK